MNRIGRFLAWGVVLPAAMTTGCQTAVPKDALKLSQSTLEVRSLQSREFDGRTEDEILAAAAGVLQDLGFEIEESETKLGLVVGTKDRDAVQTGQVVGMVALALLTGVVIPVDKNQNIRAALVCTPKGPKTQVVRVTFQRKVWNTQNQVTTVEQVVDPEIYQEFFDRLSKSVFLEAHKI
jgi:hypothetical protein